MPILALGMGPDNTLYTCKHCPDTGFDPAVQQNVKSKVD